MRLNRSFVEKTTCRYTSMSVRAIGHPPLAHDRDHPVTSRAETFSTRATLTGRRRGSLMKTQLFALVVCAAMLAAPSPSNAAAPDAAREEINKSFELSPG